MLILEDQDGSQPSKATGEAKASGVLEELESEPGSSAALG